MLKQFYQTIARLFKGLSGVYRNALWRLQLKKAGPGTLIGKYVVIHSPENVKIGAHVSIAEFVHIWGGGGVEIGDNTMIAAHSIITSLTHDKSAQVYRKTLIRSPVKIGSNVWLGSGAIVHPGVVIGDNAIIGSGAVITRDVEPNIIVAGIPAKPILAKENIAKKNKKNEM